MDHAALRALVLESNLAAFAVDVTVTRPAPDDTPIETTGIWVTPDTDMAPSIGVQTARRDGTPFTRKEIRRVLALPRADVPTIPRQTSIVAAEESGGAPKTWVVDGMERIEAEHVRVKVLHIDEDA